MAWINLAAALCAVMMLCVYTRRSVEITIPLAASLAMPVLLALAAVRGLAYVDWLAAAVLACGGIWLAEGIRRGKVISSCSLRSRALR